MLGLSGRDPGRITRVLLIVLCLAGWADPGLTEVCVDYREFMRWTGGIRTPGHGRAVDVASGHAYLADGPGGPGLTVVQLDAVGAPEVVGQTVVLDDTFDLIARNDHLYVANNGQGLKTFDISSPTEPVLRSIRPTIGFAYGVDVSDDILCVVTTRLAPDGRLHVFDISVPDTPVELGVVNTPFRANSVAINGDLVYVAVKLCLETGCVGGITIFDISDPTNPTEIGYQTTGPTTDLAITDDFALVTSDELGLWVVDIKVPYATNLVGNLPYLYAGAVTRIVDTAIVAADELSVVDVVVPTQPLVVGTVPSPTGWENDIRVRDDVAHVAGDGSLHLLDVSSLDLVQPLSIAPTKDRAWSVTGSDGYAYVASNEAGIQVVAIEPDGSSQAVASVLTYDRARDLVEENGRLYVADLARGLTIFDVSDPTTPIELGRRRSVGWSTAIAVRGDHVYLTDAGPEETEGFRVFDVSDPTIPIRVGDLALEDDGVDVVLSGSLAYVAAEALGVAIVDITDPTSPTLISTVAPVDWASAVALGDGLLFVADGAAGLSILDISQPAVPVRIGGLELTSAAITVGLIGDDVAVGLEDGGMMLIDVEIPTQPVSLGSVDTPGPAHGVADVDGFILVAADDAGLMVLPGHCGDLVAAGTDVAGPLVAAPPVILHQNAPNPFNPTTRIRFDLTTETRVRLGVFDASGRVIRSLVANEIRDAGTHEVVWNGLSDAGRSVPAGTYFYRLEAEGRVVTRKATLLP